MLAIPAIDLCDGVCVRLQQGDFARRTDYSSDPEQVVERFVAAGATRIHVVDLDGAKDGQPQNRPAIRKIARAADAGGATIQLGGGLRSMASLSDAIDSGASQLILGSSAIADFEFFRSACTKFTGQILLGLDARSGKLASDGWLASSRADPLELAQRAEAAGCAGIIHTDINRDGMLAGSNHQATAQLAAAVECPVFASGGFAHVDELAQLAQLKIAGVIIGKAIYEGKIDYADVARKAKLLQ
ncbi:MAG: 1-(5-phosphoribosyl)-5-[(5-phosphoribosylamino)methylideneamino]imidazole-4-carboxamide isomerase [Betaproteobacteria bacterium]|nr:1-(5-phosphoribosyl)-5-[(5-phosphoribosylamino)methylideneamino]imidazole-4-carboxamide isomerase [Betaproteobacteria bacterium]